MRIGELLLARGWVDAAGLARAIAEQPHTGRRLCSLLIARGLLDPDDAARALAEQRGVPGVLARHLDGREAGLAFMIPPELGRTLVILPIGRARGGELIVCVRDPSAAVQSAVEHAARHKVMLAVAPASRLEELVRTVYGDGAGQDVDVDLTTGPISLPIELDPLDVEAPQFTLVGLDDARVAKDHTQSGLFDLPTNRRSAMPPRSTPPANTTSTPVAQIAQAIAIGRTPTPQPQPGPAISRTMTPPQHAPQHAPQPAEPPPPALELDDTITALETAPSRDEATDRAMAYVAGRWTSSLLVTIKEGAALGHRGHGPYLGAVETIALPIASPSMLKIVHDTKQSTTERPAGAIQDRLSRMLGQPNAPVAAPIVVGARAIGAIVVGDARPGHAAHASEDLEFLAEALGLAYARIVLEGKQRLSSPSIATD